MRGRRLTDRALRVRHNRRSAVPVHGVLVPLDDPAVRQVRAAPVVRRKANRGPETRPCLQQLPAPGDGGPDGSAEAHRPQPILRPTRPVRAARMCSMRTPGDNQILSSCRLAAGSVQNPNPKRATAGAGKSSSSGWPCILPLLSSPPPWCCCHQRSLSDFGWPVPARHVSRRITSSCLTTASHRPVPPQGLRMPIKTKENSGSSDRTRRNSHNEVLKTVESPGHLPRILPEFSNPMWPPTIHVRTTRRQMPLRRTSRERPVRRAFP